MRYIGLDAFCRNLFQAGVAAIIKKTVEQVIHLLQLKKEIRSENGGLCSICGNGTNTGEDPSSTFGKTKGKGENPPQSQLGGVDRCTKPHTQRQGQVALLLGNAEHVNHRYGKSGHLRRGPGCSTYCRRRRRAVPEEIWSSPQGAKVDA
jgi:hypothetical protein